MFSLRVFLLMLGILCGEGGLVKEPVNAVKQQQALLDRVAAEAERLRVAGM